MKSLLFIFTMFCLIFSQGLEAYENAYPLEYEYPDDDDQDFRDCYGNTICCGPIFYHTRRIKKGGTKQSGYMYGFQASYDRIKNYCFYWGLHGYYAEGDIKGRTGRGAPLSSELADAEIEGRIGYTVGLDNCYLPSFTPFIGFGYFHQTNRFRHPSPVKFHFQDYFKYTTIGFLSSFYPLDYLKVGLNFRAKFMIEGKSRVSHDPDNHNLILLMDDEVQYSLDLPLTYFLCWKGSDVFVSLIPFAELRHYGGYENYPFDFIETRFVNIGGKFLFGTSF